MENQGTILAKAYMDAYEAAFERYDDDVDFSTQVATAVVFALANRTEALGPVKPVESMSSDEFFDYVLRGDRQCRHRHGRSEECGF